METSSALRSSHCSITNVHSLVEKSGVIPMQCNRLAISKPGAQIWQKLSFALRKRDDILLTAAIRTDEAIVNSSVTSCMDSEEKSAIKNGTFPKGFEKLLLEVCDETEIAELKLKIGEFEMHVKRNVGGSKVLPSVISPSIPPPIPSEPMDMSAAYAPPPEAKPQKPSTEKHSPFTNVTFGKSSRLATLEASGASGYVVVSSPTVGSFRRGRTFKGKKLPPTYKEGDLIKVGQVIGWIDQFDTELPIKSDVTGEVMKLLIDEGDAVGFGDPLIAVLPSFQGI